MNTATVTYDEVRRAWFDCRVAVAYPRLKMIALDGKPRRPATEAALAWVLARRGSSRCIDARQTFGRRDALVGSDE